MSKSWPSRQPSRPCHRARHHGRPCLSSRVPSPTSPPKPDLAPSKPDRAPPLERHASPTHRRDRDDATEPERSRSAPATPEVEPVPARRPGAGGGRARSPRASHHLLISVLSLCVPVTSAYLPAEPPLPYPADSTTFGTTFGLTPDPLTAAAMLATAACATDALASKHTTIEYNQAHTDPTWAVLVTYPPTRRASHSSGNSGRVVTPPDELSFCCDNAPTDLCDGTCQPTLEVTVAAEPPAPAPHPPLRSSPPLPPPLSLAHAILAASSLALVPPLQAHLAKSRRAAAAATAATAIQAVARGRRVRRAKRAVLRACRQLQACAGDHLRVDLPLAWGRRATGGHGWCRPQPADFHLTAAPPPTTVTIALDGEPVDVFEHLDELVVAATAIQAGVRGWFVRRSMLPADMLQAGIDAHHKFGRTTGHSYTTASLYLHPVADRLSWIYCQRQSPCFVELDLVADALCQVDSTHAVIPPVSLKRATSAKKRGKQRVAARRVQRDARVDRRHYNRGHATSVHGFIFRPAGPNRRLHSRMDEMLSALVLHALRQRSFPFLNDLPAPRLSPHPGYQTIDRSLAGSANAFVTELRDRFGDRFVSSIWPREATAEERCWLRVAALEAGAEGEDGLSCETDSDAEDGLDWVGGGGELGSFIG